MEEQDNRDNELVIESKEDEDRYYDMLAEAEEYSKYLK